MNYVEATKLEIGQAVPDFELTDTEEVSHTLSVAKGEKATVVIFTCNHCPYALAWHDRLMDVARDYRDRGVSFLAINSNDAERYPADSFEAMKERVAESPWEMPYLHDKSQQVAVDWGAKTTPDVFVLDADQCLQYRGAADSDYEDPAQNAELLREALDDILAGDEVRRPQTEPVGCSIKWRS